MTPRYRCYTCSKGSLGKLFCILLQGQPQEHTSLNFIKLNLVVQFAPQTL